MINTTIKTEISADGIKAIWERIDEVTEAVVEDAERFALERNKLENYPPVVRRCDIEKALSMGALK